jgi:phosphoglycerol transferase MdoB-like AlkP superfamily enzyme
MIFLCGLFINSEITIDFWYNIKVKRGVKKMQEKTKTSLLLYFFIFLFIFYLEVVFKLSITSFRFEYLRRIFLFTSAYSLFAILFIRFLPRKVFKVFLLILGLLGIFLYFAQDIYYRILSGFFSFDIAGDAHKATAFLSRIFVNLTWVHLLYLLPLVLLIYFYVRYRKKEIPEKHFFYGSIFDFFQWFIIATLLFTTIVHTLPKKPENYFRSPYIYAEYDFYTKAPSAYQTINKFGMLTYIQRDFANKFREDPDEGTVYEEIIEYGQERDEHVEDPLYNGYFEGKNMIFIMAESFDTFAINPSLTPNIYRMQNDSWNFNNFYSPLYYRNTADTEFMSQTGFYTSRHTPLTMETYKDNYFPYTLPKIFKEAGYGTYSFHNYTDYFYPRSDFHPNTLGYDEYYDAVDFGFLEEPKGVITNHIWQSDADLVEESLNILLDKPQPFFSYILTVSGHMDYEEGHPIADQHIDDIRQIFIDEGRDMPADDILYYHAANYELDLAIGILLDRLEAEGIAEDTVIVFFGDHYAYGLDKDDIGDYVAITDPNDEKANEDSPLGELRFQRVPMMIYNPGKTDVYRKDFTEVFASIDIMPTIANLFDLDLEYSYVFGKDVFSNQRQAVYFSNGSILTEDFFFDSENEEFVMFDLDDSLTEDEIVEKYSEAEAFYGEYLYRQIINESILDIDFFWLMEELNKD